MHDIIDRLSPKVFHFPQSFLFDVPEPIGISRSSLEQCGGIEWDECISDRIQPWIGDGKQTLTAANLAREGFMERWQFVEFLGNIIPLSIGVQTGPPIGAQTGPPWQDWVAVI